MLKILHKCVFIAAACGSMLTAHAHTQNPDGTVICSPTENIAVCFFAGAVAQGDHSVKPVMDALTDALVLPLTELRTKRYANYTMVPNQWTFEEVLAGTYTSGSRMPNGNIVGPGSEGFMEAVKQPEAIPVLKKALADMVNAAREYGSYGGQATGGIEDLSNYEYVVQNEILTPFYDEQLRAYPVKPAPVGKKAPLQLKGNREALRYKTNLGRAWNEATEPNFAGHYFAVDSIGCGTGCRVTFVIEWNTGRIFKVPYNAYFHSERTSRLLILFDAPYCTADGPPILYVFDGAKFREIKHDKCKNHGPIRADRAE
ncbi:MAG: hypothetical protein LBE24_06080 [Methylobacillus sp.]|jgi:hypothetical protein|nr:hypothetical protein [Methylobacillus sp.]